MREPHKPAIVLLLVVLLSSLFFLGLYQFDNKYTHKGLQAQNGLLVLSQEDMEENPIHYLVRGWAFYPGVLLSPEDLKDQQSSRYMVYTNIGDNTHFNYEGDKEDPHGKGTYLLHLRLPKGLTTYALDMPEIFSAYRLYINGRLSLSMGNPDQQNYQPLTQRRLVTFDADGEATILIAVSDYSHFYSGLVYPPAFGKPLALSVLRDLLLGICVAINTMALVMAVLALYAGLRMKHKHALLFSLTCMVMIGFTSYAPLHSVFALPVFPWYALELSLGYVLTLLVLILHNRICKVGYLTMCISVGTAVVFCLAALCYGLFAPRLTVSLKTGFSGAVFLFKAATASYLLVTAGLSLKQKGHQAEPLFYASVFYATAFVWDRILPDFEPVISGWFSEWGSLVLVLAIGYTLWRDMITSYAYSLAFAEEHRQVTRQLAMQTEYSRQIGRHNEENRRLLHDFRQHLRTIEGLSAQIKKLDGAQTLGDELQAYLRQLPLTGKTTTNYLGGAFSKNAAVDALLQYYFTVAGEEKIKVDFRLLLPDQLGLTDVELCTVLGNLLENAVEACRRLTGQQGSISILTQQEQDYLLIQIINTFDGEYQCKEGHFLSAKRGNQRLGISLESAREIVQRHGGSMIFDIEEKLFCVGVSLPVCP